MTTTHASGHEHSDEMPAGTAILRRNIADALAMPDGEDIEFDPPPVVIESRPAGLS